MGPRLFTLTLDLMPLKKKSYMVKIIRMPSLSVYVLTDDMLIKIKIRTLRTVVYQYKETNPSMKSGAMDPL